MLLLYRKLTIEITFFILKVNMTSVSLKQIIMTKLI